MTNLERSQTDSEPKTWSYNTRYDVVKWPQLRSVGQDSAAIRDIENYVDYINNEMPEGYMALTRLTQNHNDSAWLYEITDNGDFVPTHQVWNMPQFMGNQIVLHNDNIFLLHKNQGVAAKPLESITMINTVENPRKTRHIEIKILSAKLLTEQRKKLASRALTTDNS